MMSTPGETVAHREETSVGVVAGLGTGDAKELVVGGD